METDDPRAAARALAAEVMERCLIAGSARTGEISRLGGTLPPWLATIAAAFEQNISAVVSTTAIPFTLASAAINDRYWQRLHMAERIRALSLKANPGEDEASLDERRASFAYDVASKRMEAFTTGEVGRDAFAADTCSFLLKALKAPEFSEAANELLRQGVVLTWSALEILSRDLFEALLNNDPKRALGILQEPTAKHRLQSKFTLEDLATAGFDLSRSLGSLLSSQQDFSDIRTIKAVMLPALGRERDVEAALEDRALWVLCQQRHLIVHRRGVVDTRYRDATGESQQIGERIVVGPADLELQLEKVVHTGRALVLAASKHAG